MTYLLLLNILNWLLNKNYKIIIILVEIVDFNFSNLNIHFKFQNSIFKGMIFDFSEFITIFIDIQN